MVSFLHFVEDDQKTLFMQNWSTRTKRNYCNAERIDSKFDIGQAGVWADCVREATPIIHNDYESLTNKKGMPPAHPKIVRELLVPVIRGGKIKAVLGVGNKPTDYYEKDLGVVSLLSDLIWDITEVLLKNLFDEREHKFRTKSGVIILRWYLRK